MLLVVLFWIDFYASAEESPYPQRRNIGFNVSPKVVGKIDIYPKEIHYGDAFFVTTSIRNEENTQVACNFYPLDYDFGFGSGVIFGNDNKIYYRWCSPDLTHRLMNPVKILTKRVKPEKTTVRIEPKSTKQLLFNMYWLPVLGLPPDKDLDVNQNTADITSVVKLRDMNFTFQSTISVKLMNDVEGIPDLFINSFADLHSSDQKITSSGKILIKSRSDEALRLLHDWYGELPIGVWESNGVFVRLFAAKKTGINAETIQTKKTDIKYKDFRERNTEVINRIVRTNELAEKLLKLPDSELSQNMKEFIQLRRFLVDMRFAESPDKEEKAFEELVSFVDKSKDKAIWISLVSDCVLGGVWCDGDSTFLYDDQMTYRKMWNYRNRFNKKFMEINLQSK